MFNLHSNRNPIIAVVGGIKTPANATDARYQHNNKQFKLNNNISYQQHNNPYQQ